MYEFIALAIPMKHVHPVGKCNKSMTGKLNKHIRTSSDEEDEFASEEDDGLSGGGEESDDSQVDPRWNELKKILDNN